MKRIQSFYSKNEFWVFVIISIITSSHVFIFYVFPTLDGPHHLHSANMILEFLGNNELVQSYYKFNAIPVSHLVGHSILAMFNFFLPAPLALNLLIFMYMMGMAFSYRHLMIVISGRFSPVNYAIFPFMLNGSLTLGLFNFSLSIILFFILLAYWLKIYKTLNTRQLIQFGLLLTLMIFCHLLGFLFIGLTIIVFLIYETLYNYFRDGRIPLKALFIKILKLVIITVPSILFLTYYMLSISDFLTNVQQDVYDNMSLLGNLYFVKPLIIYHEGMDGKANIPLFIGLMVLSLLSFTFWLKNRKNTEKLLFNKYFVFTMAFFFLLLLLIVPSGFLLGTMRIRLSLFFFLFLIMFLGTLKNMKYVELLAAIFFLFIFTEHQFRMGPLRSRHSINAEEVHSMARLMEPNSIFLPVYAGPNWADEYILNYIGSDKPLINLKNPQAYGPFPMMYEIKEMPYTTFGGHDMTEIEIEYVTGPKTNKRLEIDYVIIYYERLLKKRRQAGEFSKFYEILDSKFELIGESTRKRTTLYKRIDD